MKRCIFSFLLFFSLFSTQLTHSSQTDELLREETLKQEAFEIETLSRKYNINLLETFQFSVGQENINFDYAQIKSLDKFLTMYPRISPLEVKDRLDRIFYEFSKKTYNKVEAAFALLYMSFEKGQTAQEMTTYLHDLGIFAEIFTYNVELNYEPVGYSWYTVALAPILGFFPGTMPFYALMLIGNAMRTVGAEKTYENFAYQLAPMSVLYDDFSAAHISVEAYANMVSTMMKSQYHGNYQKVILEIIERSKSYESAQ